MLFIEIVKTEVTGGHISIILSIEITKIDFIDGHIRIMLIIECQIRMKRRPYWNYANYELPN